MIDAKTIEHLRKLAREHYVKGTSEDIERLAWQLESDAKLYADSEKLQDIGKSAMASITDMVAALAAGDCEDRDDAERRIQEDALSVQVKDGWYSPYDEKREGPEEFEILLSTGPATRIIGELDEHGEPKRARLQTQDWSLPWTDYVGADQETLLTYCRQFYFGEG